MRWFIAVLSCVGMCGGSEVPFGAHATLRAEANGKPAPSYVWFKDGERVGEGANLPIEAATLNDAGTYVCQASNGIGPGASSMPLIVVVAQAPVITVSFPNVDL